MPNTNSFSPPLVRPLLGLVAQVAITVSILGTLGPATALFQVGVAVYVHTYMAALDYIAHSVQDEDKPRLSRPSTSFPIENALTLHALAPSQCLSVKEGLMLPCPINALALLYFAPLWEKVMGWHGKIWS